MCTQFNMFHNYTIIFLTKRLINSNRFKMQTENPNSNWAHEIIDFQFVFCNMLLLDIIPFWIVERTILEWAVSLMCLFVCLFVFSESVECDFYLCDPREWKYLPKKPQYVKFDCIGNLNDHIRQLHKYRPYTDWMILKLLAITSQWFAEHKIRLGSALQLMLLWLFCCCLLLIRIETLKWCWIGLSCAETNQIKTKFALFCYWNA